MLTRPVLSCAAVVAGALALSSTPSAMADTSEALTSANWAGYTATSPTSGQPFTHVAGSWVVPSVDCSTSAGDSSFWIGLGGAGGDNTGLEQTGTSADCSSGSAQYSAWYELIPAAPVSLDLAISPGDHVSATVDVDGSAVRVAMTDHTTGQSVNRSLSTDSVDVSSAEWIAEAPSMCSDAGCQPVSLADFGSVTFSDASATAGGHTGTISDGQWTATPMVLTVDDGFSSGATPTDLNGAGDGFSVSTDAAQSATPDSGGGYDGGDPSGGGDPYGAGNPYGGGDPYGYGSSPGYGGYGDPYGYGGGGSDPYGANPGYGDQGGYGYGF